MDEQCLGSDVLDMYETIFGGDEFGCWGWVRLVLD